MLAVRVEWGYYRFLRWEDKIKIICKFTNENPIYNITSNFSIYIS